MKALYEFVDKVGRTFVTVLAIVMIFVASSQGWNLDSSNVTFIVFSYIGGNAVIKATANLNGNGKAAPRKRGR